MGGINRGYPDFSTEVVDWNHCTYQFPTSFSATDSVNHGNEFFGKTIKSLHQCGGDEGKKVVSIYSRFTKHTKPIKDVENGLR